MAKKQPGSYFIILHLLKESSIQIGKKGRFTFPGGFYIYTGSAMNGIWQRLKRICPCRRKMNLHWHIDYFIRYPLVQVLEMYGVPEIYKNECVYNLRILQVPGASTPVKDFGSSDCTAGCPGHLVHFESYPKSLWEYTGVKGKVYPIEYFEEM